MSAAAPAIVPVENLIRVQAKAFCACGAVMEGDGDTVVCHSTGCLNRGLQFRLHINLIEVGKEN